MCRLARYVPELVFRIRNLRHAKAWIADRIEDKRLDRSLGISSSDRRTLHELGIRLPDCVDYQPVSYSDFRCLMNSISIGPDDVFLDLGCGMGRAVCLAAFYPVRSIIGVEISPELCEIARENVARLRSRFACSNIQIVNLNATQYDVPADVSVVFFFNPFGGAVMKAVLDRVAESVRSYPRKLKVIFCGTVSASDFRAEADTRGWLRFYQEMQLPTGVRSLIYEARSGTV